MDDQQHTPDQPGDIFHHELRSTDPRATREFFSRVFGWTFTMMDVPGADISLFDTPGRSEGHLMAPDDGTTATVVAYVLVTDIDAIAAEIEAAGGRIVVPRQEAPNMGSFLTFEAPGGPTFMAWQHAAL